MAIAYDNSASFRADSSGTHSISYTCATGAYMVVMMHNTVTSVTYNGVALSTLFSFTNPISDGNGNNIIVYGLANPASGTHTLDVTLSGNQSVCVATYTGINRSATQPEASNSQYSNNGTNNTQVTGLSTSVTTLTDNAWTILFATGSNNNQNFTGGTGTTLRTSYFDLFASTAAILDSNGVITPPGSSTLTANWASGVGFMSLAIFSMTPDAGFIPQLLIL